MRLRILALFAVALPAGTARAADDSLAPVPPDPAVLLAPTDPVSEPAAESAPAPSVAPPIAPPAPASSPSPITSFFAPRPTKDAGVQDTADRERRERAYRGVYGRVDLLGAAIGTQSPGACEGQAGCEASGSYGAWAGLRIGYSFGFVGLEVGGTILGDLRLAHAPAPSSSNIQGLSPGMQGLASAAQQPNYLYYGVGGIIGAGPRFTTKGHAVRFTAGVLPGVTVRSLGVRRQVGADAAIETGFGVAADAGVSIGSTPGVRLYLGLMAFADFTSHAGAASGSPTSFSSTSRPAIAPAGQLYLGPVLGLAFGH